MDDDYQKTVTIDEGEYQAQSRLWACATLTPALWQAVSGIQILDPDGWDRDSGWDVDWNTPISWKEFQSRCARSTLGFIPTWIMTQGGAQ